MDAHITCLRVRRALRAILIFARLTKPVFLIRFLRKMLAEGVATWTWWKLKFPVAVFGVFRHRSVFTLPTVSLVPRPSTPRPFGKLEREKFFPL